MACSVLVQRRSQPKPGSGTWWLKRGEDYEIDRGDSGRTLEIKQTEKKLTIAEWQNQWVAILRGVPGSHV